MYENDGILKYAHQITRQGFILVRGTPWNSPPPPQKKDMGEARYKGEPTPENDWYPSVNKIKKRIEMNSGVPDPFGDALLNHLSLL